MRTALFSPLVLCLAACSQDDGRWLGRCGTSLRIDLDVPADESTQPLGTLWSADRPDDALDFTCVRQASRSKVVELAECTGAWRSDGLTGPLSFTLDGKVQKGENLPSLVGTCVWDGASAPLELLRVHNSGVDPTDTGDTGGDSATTDDTGSTTP